MQVQKKISQVFGINNHRLLVIDLYICDARHFSQGFTAYNMLWIIIATVLKMRRQEK